MKRRPCRLLTRRKEGQHGLHELRLPDDDVEALHDAGGEEFQQAGLQEAVGVGHSGGHHHHPPQLLQDVLWEGHEHVLVPQEATLGVESVECALR